MGNAAGRKRRQIIAKALAHSTHAFLLKRNIGIGMKGLDLGCGTGAITLYLKEMVGAEGKMMGIDMDATSIKIAIEKAEQKKH